MGTLPQTLEIIFEVQRKRNNEKIKKREISFPTYKIYFIIFLSSFLDPSYLKTS